MKEQQDIDLLEALVDLRLPDGYKALLNNKPLVRRLGFAGLPLSLEADSAWGATMALRQARPDLLPPRLLALLTVGSLCLCLDCSGDPSKEPVLVEVDLDGEQAPRPVFDSLQALLKDDVVTANAPLPWPALLPASGPDPWFAHGLKRLEWHMSHLAFDYEHGKGGKLPRSHLWRPFRFCVQDVILGICVMRLDRRLNRLEVDVFLTAAIPEYEPDTGCRALALNILSDAYQSGSSMEIHFTRHVEGGRVPGELCALAARLGVKLKHADQGGISPREASFLYLALSGVSGPLLSKVDAMAKEGKASAAALSYSIGHGVWSADELAVILGANPFADAFLNGGWSPECWHLFHHDLLIARNALMGSYLERQLRRREHQREGQDGGVVELEDDERHLQIGFEAGWLAKHYTIAAGEDPAKLPWLASGQSGPCLSAEQPLWVLLRARDGTELELDLGEDLETAVKLKETVNEPKATVAVMVPADFARIKNDRFIKKANECGIGLILCPDGCAQMDQQIVKRLETMKVMRR